MAVDVAVVALLAEGVALVAFAVSDATRPAASFRPASQRHFCRLHCERGVSAIKGGGCLLSIRRRAKCVKFGEWHVGKVGENVSAQRSMGNDGCNGR